MSRWPTFPESVFFRDVERKSEADMPPFRIAAAAHCLEGPLKRKLQRAVEIGLSGLSFDARRELPPTSLSETGRRQFLHHVNERGLKVASLSFPTRGAYYDLDRLDDRVAGTKAAMQFAYQLNARVLTARVGRIPADKASQEYKTLVDVLNELASYGNHVGAVFTLTPSGDTIEQLQLLLKAVDQGPIGINYDPAGLLMAGRDPVLLFRELYGSVHQIVVRDSIRDADSGGTEVPVGRGDVKWDEVLAMLDAADYHGWLVADRTTGDDQLDDVTRAVKYLKQVAMDF